MRVYGLIGYPLTHSFSKKYFTEKFEKEGISGCVYENFEIPAIDAFPALVRERKNLKGLNVTIPYKQEVMPFLSGLDSSAERVGAVNVIKLYEDGRLVGFNSDYYGFRQALLEDFLPEDRNGIAALVLGTGGASKAVRVALEDLNIPYRQVSRRATEESMAYQELSEEVVQQHRLIINTTPLGMYPKTDTAPDLPYTALTSGHFLFDLVYNPAQTLFMKKGAARGARVKNGLRMLHLQAEKAWEIWNM
jgi:shikimate dehydrogenase